MLLRRIGKIESTSTVFDHLSQAGVTDWEFLEGLARQIGYEIAVKDGKFDFRKPQKADAAPAGEPGAPGSAGALKAAAGEPGDAVEALIAERVRTLQASSIRCPSCGPRPESDALFCSSCGRSLTVGGCATCGAPLVPGSRFCEGCGTAVPR